MKVQIDRNGIKFDPIFRPTDNVDKTIHGKILRNRWSGFGGMRERFDSISPPRLLEFKKQKVVCNNIRYIYPLNGSLK